MDGHFAQLYSQQQGAIAVMMIDIDKFKDINDSFELPKPEIAI